MALGKVGKPVSGWRACVAPSRHSKATGGLAVPGRRRSAAESATCLGTCLLRGPVSSPPPALHISRLPTTKVCSIPASRSRPKAICILYLQNAQPIVLVPCHTTLSPCQCHPASAPPGGTIHWTPLPETLEAAVPTGPPDLHPHHQHFEQELHVVCPCLVVFPLLACQ